MESSKYRTYSAINASRWDGSFMAVLVREGGAAPAFAHGCQDSADREATAGKGALEQAEKRRERRNKKKGNFISARR